MKMLFVILCMLIILVSCSTKPATTSSPLDFIDRVQSTDLSNETGGLKVLNSPINEVVKERGEPQSKGKLVTGETILEYADYQYILLSDKVTSYTLKAGSLTSKELKIGDREERIYEEYGLHFYTRQQDDLGIKGYIDKENDRIIEFVLDDNQITMILVAQLSIFK